LGYLTKQHTLVLYNQTMNRSIYIVFIVLFIFASCKSKEKISGTHIFKIDSTIKPLAEQKIWKDRFEIEHYKDDSLVITDIDTSYTDIYANYFWKHDTLNLAGYIGDMTATGFYAYIYKDTTVDFFHNQCAHIHKFYKVKLSDTLATCVHVPCTYSELIISKLPDSTKDEDIYGYVNFKSIDYYYQNQHEPSKRKTNMKFYFKASNLNYYLIKHHLHLDPNNED
jgi:hypothetical protein